MQSLVKNAHGSLSQAQIRVGGRDLQGELPSQFGFSQPLPVKFALQLYHLFTFQFGTSYFNLAPNGSNPVSAIIVAYLPNTIVLFTTGTILVVLVGSVVGLLAARSAGGKLDRSIPFIAVFHSSLPTWWVGFLFIAFFAYTLNIFPSGGIISVPPPGALFPRFGDFLYHLTLPLTAFFVVNVGGFAYVIRSLVVSTMGEDFVLTAKARGIIGQQDTLQARPEDGLPQHRHPVDLERGDVLRGRHHGGGGVPVARARASSPTTPSSRTTFP